MACAGTVASARNRAAYGFENSLPRCAICFLLAKDYAGRCDSRSARRCGRCNPKRRAGQGSAGAIDECTGALSSRRYPSRQGTAVQCQRHDDSRGIIGHNLTPHRIASLRSCEHAVDLPHDPLRPLNRSSNHCIGSGATLWRAEQILCGLQVPRDQDSCHDR
jgi:hypothetical protein